MITLSKFYELMSRNATVNLTSPNLDNTYFKGSVKDIPDSYDGWMVTDFTVSGDGDVLFKIEK